MQRVEDAEMVLFCFYFWLTMRWRKKAVMNTTTHVLLIQKKIYIINSYPRNSYSSFEKFKADIEMFI